MLRNVVIAIAAVLLLMPAATLGQPTFDIASVKPSPSGGGGMDVTFDTGRLTLRNATLKFCIEFAYRVKDFQVSGGPAWLASETFDIDAKAAGPADSQELRRLLQTLLADRFQLRVRLETKEGPTYALIVARGGSKLHEVPPGDGPEMRTSRNRLNARKISMSGIAQALSGLLGHTVVDLTGLKGVYDVILNWAPDERQTTQKPGVPAEAVAPGENASGPSIFAAVQEQLGLRLEARRGPVETLVVDHAERPTAN